MNSLTPTPSSPPDRPTAPALSPALSRLLDSDGPPDEAAKQIAHTAALCDEARAALPALRAVAGRRAGEEGVYAVVSRRFGTLGKPSLSEEEWRNWWADYYDVCADLPLASLEAGMRAWVANPEAQFIPKPGKLRELAETAPSLTLRRYQRALRALQVADGQGGDDTPRISDPGQSEIVRRMLAECQAGLKAKGQAKLQHPTPRPVRTDEKGVTEEMRALMARRAEQGR
jgi:hypothetical protein